jgi:molybdenum cofactor synthesis domain-containing protein
VRSPRVRIVVTGAEVVAAGVAKSLHQVFDANSPMLRALTLRDGGVVEALHRIGDDVAQLRSVLEAPGADVVLVSGGSSVGTEDHAPTLVAELGELAIHGVAMRPSSPAGIGRIGETLVFLLPGNPVSCLCAYDFFAGRANQHDVFFTVAGVERLAIAGGTQSKSNASELLATGRLEELLTYIKSISARALVLVDLPRPEDHRPHRTQPVHRQDRLLNEAPPGRPGSPAVRCRSSANRVIRGCGSSPRSPC